MKKRLNPYAHMALAIILALASGCGKGTMDGSSPAGSSGNNSGGNSNQISPFNGPDPNKGLDVRKMASEADSYAITYGQVTPEAITTLKTYPLVIVHPYNGNLSRDHIMWIKQGAGTGDTSKNPVVLCYISIGEDERTFQLTDAQMLADPRFTGDGSGPSVDPRGPGPSNRPLVGLNPKGTPTYGGFASFYLNDNAVRLGCPGDPPLKSPDRNNNFQARFVNAGDPTWYDTVKNMKMDPATHTPPGLKELLTDNYGRGLGCDGVFLDTVDTAAPNYYTSCSDTTHSSSEWTAKGFADFIARLRADFPNKVILQNRGLFFFDPRKPHYEVNTRGLIDLGFFESYHLGNDSATNVSTFFEDNKYNVAAKLMAEANRPDGFKVLSLGYGDGFDGNKPGMDIRTLLGNSTLGYDYLVTDLQESMAVGFRHYITNAEITLVNPFVKNYISSHDIMNDVTPPQWSSVYNAYYNYSPVARGDARAGIQQATNKSAGSITVSWDVALDMNRVSYLLYYKTSPFDFSADPKLTSATRMLLTPSAGAGYGQVWSAGNPNLQLQNVYPYEATIAGLQTGTLHYFVIRAIDSKGNEDNNQVVLTATP